MSAEERASREDVEALLETRRELGPAYDAALVDSFADRLERVVADRVDAQVRARVEGEVAREQRADLARSAAGVRQLVLAVVSVLACVPLSLALGLNGRGDALVLTMAAILAINLAHALQGWQGRRR